MVSYIQYHTQMCQKCFSRKKSELELCGTVPEPCAVDKRKNSPPQLSLSPLSLASRLICRPTHVVQWLQRRNNDDTLLQIILQRLFISLALILGSFSFALRVGPWPFHFAWPLKRRETEQRQLRNVGSFFPIKGPPCP